MTSLWHFLSCASHRTENFHLAKVIEPQFPLGFFLFSIEFQSVIYMSVICKGVEGVCLLNYHPHPAKIDLNKKWLQKQMTIQNFNIDAQGLRKTRNENPPMQETGFTS